MQLCENERLSRHVDSPLVNLRQEAALPEPSATLRVVCKRYPLCLKYIIIMRWQLTNLARAALRRRRRLEGNEEGDAGQEIGQALACLCANSRFDLSIRYSARGHSVAQQIPQRLCVRGNSCRRH